MLYDAEQVPSPRRRLAEDKIQSQPQHKERPVETRRPAGDLCPYIIRKVFPNVTGGLQPRIAYEVVIIKDEPEIQCGAVNGEDCCRQCSPYDGKGQG